MCSETPSEGGKFAPPAVQEFGGSLVPLKAGTALTPLSTQLFWPRFPGTSHRGEASAVSRGSQNVSSTHLYTSHFLLRGWETCGESSLCYKLLKTPAKPVWNRAGLKKSPVFLISSAACCQLLRAIWLERQFFSL